MTDNTSPFAWGVDGCKAGWFWFRLPVLQSVPITWGVANTLKELLDGENRTIGDDGVVLAAPAEDDLMLVDMPIGLPNPDKKGRKCVSRDCDWEARRRLKKRGRSVFPVPTRAAMREFESHYLANQDRDEKALKLAARLVRPIPPPTAGLFPKLFEVDRLMSTHRGASKVVRETHPEVCFWALGPRPMEYSKREPAGRRERRQVLKHCRPDSVAAIDRALREFPRRDVAEDDMLDAMVCALTAALILEDGGTLRAMSDDPRTHPDVLPREIVYAEPSS